MSVIATMLDVWGAAMWRASWQGGLAAMAIWFVCRLVLSIPARFQCWLWRLVMLKFLVALVWSVPIELPLLPASAEPTAWVTSEPILSNSIPAENVQFAQNQSPGFLPFLMIPFVVWIVVVLWQMARIVAACRNARRLRNGCRVSESRQLLDPLARFSKLIGLVTPPLVLEMDGQGSPLLIGILRPAIVLPTSTLSQLDASERVLVIGHELAHVGRRDLLCSLVAAVIRTLFFFHPLAWLSEMRLGLTQEIAADELAIALQKQVPARYASLLVSIVSKLGPTRMVPTISVGAAGSHSSLKRRLSAMRFMKQVSPQGVIAYSIVLGLVAVLGLVPWSIVAMTASAADRAVPQETTVSGRFVSFKDGILKVKVPGERSDVVLESEWKVAEETRVVGHIRGTAQEGTVRDAFKLWESGAVIAVTAKDGKVTFVEIGIKKTEDSVPDRAPEKTADKFVQKTKTERGKFVSFKDGTLTLKANSGALIGNKITDSTMTMVWSYDEGVYKPADTAKVLNQIEPGAWIVVRVANENVALHIGARKGSTLGTFVSFKDNRLLIIGKDLGESFTKKYGNNVHFNQFFEDVPVYESIDGGEYKLIGTPKTVLPNVKEGTIVTVHGEGDDNITRIQIGVPKKK